MKTMKIIWFAPIALAAGLVGCATPNQQPYYGTSPQPYYGSSPAPSPTYPAQGYPQNYPEQNQSNQMGYVDRIEVINRSGGNNATGTIIGAIIGGLIGTQIGSGSGRTAATVAGAVGGAVVGNVIEGRRRADHETFRVTVRKRRPL